jgi:heterodisulfide reductase subunit A
MTTNLTTTPTGAVLVIGGGISGMQSALDLANAGIKVYLVESSPAIGGKMAQLDKTFPTNDCSMCIVSPKLVEVGRHRNITLLTHSEVKELRGSAGSFQATIVNHARYVDVAACTGCGLCELVCPVTHVAYFPEALLPGGDGKLPRAKEKRLISRPGTVKPTSSHKWTFTVDEAACGKCGACQRACLQEAITWEKKQVAVIDQNKCTGCGACLVACPEKFLAIVASDAPELEKSIGAAVKGRSMMLRKEYREQEDKNCIRCGLCAITCEKVMKIGALKMVEEGIEAAVDLCQVCGGCVSVCPVDFLAIDQVTNKQPRPLLNMFNEGLNSRKPVNIHYPQAVPRVPTIDPNSCVQLNTGGCGTCATICGVGAIHYDHVEKEQTVDIGSVIFSPGIEVFDPKLRGEFGYGLYPNVVTSIEFERLLSASGPTSGTVARPGDGKHPRKIAWIQCVGSRDHSCNRDYCSSVCCMYATKEAFIAREHDRSIEPTIFYIDMRSFGKNFDAYVSRAKDNNVRYVRAMVSRVFEDPLSGDLELRYVDEQGERQREQFDMVVLSVGIQVSAKAKDLARTLDIDLDRYGFVVTDYYRPLATSRPGVFVSGAVNGPKDIPETVCEASAAAEAASAQLAAARGSLITQEVLPPEQVVKEDDELRIGVFICHCGTNIASVVDVEAVAAYARSLPGVVYAEHPLYTCSQDSQERIREIIKEHRLNRVVASACSPTTHEPLFMSTLQQAGLNKYFFDMANIRDQCSWVHPASPAEATEKAKRLTRMAVANATAGEPLQEMEFSVDNRLLVVGGGVAGMTAALEAAKQGFGVYLVEREAQLGGQLHQLARAGGRLVGDYLAALAKEIHENELIRVFTSSEVVAQSGFVGSFESDIALPSGVTRTVKHGAILVATGAEEHRPEVFGLGEQDQVMTQTDFEQWLENSALDTMSAPRVVMIQCAGSRDPEHLSYCSRVCCNQAVKNGLRLLARAPGARVDILYRDMRCYGLGEEDYRAARLAGVNFIRFDPEKNPPMVKFEDGKVQVLVEDPSIRLPVHLLPDYLVLSVGMKPRDAEELASMLRVPRNDHGFFIEAHAKLRPVDLPSEGLFMAGTAHGPKSSSEAVTQAQAAVARVTTLLAKKNLKMSGIVSVVDPTNCAVCLTCVRACPYGVPFINEEHSAEINPALCQGCGICVAECPAKTIHLGRYDDRNIKAKIESYSAP